jgi:hypothetical protein
VDRNGPLPEYENHVLGSSLRRPRDCELIGFDGDRFISGVPSRFPSHPSFGGLSGVAVLAPPTMGGVVKRAVGTFSHQKLGDPIMHMATSSSGIGPNLPVTSEAPNQSNTPTFDENYRGRAGPVEFRFLPRPPHDHPMFYSSGPRGRSFTINVRYTGFDRQPHRYRVYESMPVRMLQYRISIQLLQVDPRGIRIFVNDRILFHRGNISHQFDPDRPTVSTPYLVPNSVAEIRIVAVGDFGPPNRPVQLTLPDGPGTLVDDAMATIDEPPPFSSSAFSEDSDSTTDDDEGTLGDVLDVSTPPAPRRISTRIRDQRFLQHRDQGLPLQAPPERRRVGDRWYYAPDATSHSNPRDQSTEESSSSAVYGPAEEPLTQAQVTQLSRRYNVEGRNRRSVLKARVHRAWTKKLALSRNNLSRRTYSQEVVREAPTPDGVVVSSSQSIRTSPYEMLYGQPCPVDMTGLFDDVLEHALDAFLSQRLDAGGIIDVNVVYDEFLALQLDKFDRILDDNKRLFLDAIHSRIHGETTPNGVVSDDLLQRRTAALWAGLRRVYFAEREPELDMNAESTTSLPWASRRVSCVSDDMNVPISRFFHPPDDPDDAPN